MNTYSDYLKSEDWHTKRGIKYSSGKGCAICSSKDNLNIHHLNYRNLTDVSQSDLRILCRRCHKLAHNLYKKGKIRFKSDNHHSRFTLIKTAVKKELGLTSVNLFKQL